MFLKSNDPVHDRTVFSKRRLVILMILAAAGIGARIAAFLYFQAHGAVVSWEYDAIAENIMAGKGFGIFYLNTFYRSYFPVLYPFLLAAIYQIFGLNIAFAIIFQMILSLFLALAAYAVALRVSPRHPLAAILAFALTLFHPGLFIYSVKHSHTLVLDALLFLAAILFIFRLAEKPGWKRALAAGAVFGAGMLARGSLLAFLPVACLWLFLGQKNTGVFKRSLGVIFIFFVTALLPLGLWTLRNYTIHRKFVLTTTGGNVFWRGNNPHASGTSYTPDGQTVFGVDTAFYNRMISAPGELSQDAIFKQAARDFIYQDPVRFAALTIKKFYYFWWFSPTSGKTYPRNYYLLYKLGYIGVLLLAVLGGWRIIKHGECSPKWHAVLMAAFMLAIAAFQSLYYVEGRHRWGIEPVLLIFTAIGGLEGFLFLRGRCAAAVRAH